MDMTKFKVVTDGSADLSNEIVKARDITVVPFYVMLGEGEYLRQGIDIDTPDFYDWMIKNPTKFPKSAAPSAQDYLEVFSKAAEAGEKVICICITCKFSSSYQSAAIARTMVLDDYPEASIMVIDSTVNTVLQGQIVLEACDLRDAEFNYDEAIIRLEAIKSTGRIFFTIGGMEYLSVGGRIGKLAGKVSSMLNIKPIITLREGEIHAAGVARGRMKSLDKVLNIAKDYLSENFLHGDDFSITLGYGSNKEEVIGFRDKVSEMLESLKLGTEVPIRRIGAVIGVHTGPYPLGIGILKRSCKAI
ncbi:MAG: DegV family protein [Clostridia bacterium]|nr:DegV family protein [Clostridia bacterium]NCC69168.1 DegV family protein [Clostridia bacterium]